MNSYMKRIKIISEESFHAGEMVGMQKIADLMAIVLNDAGVMGKDVFGSNRIKKIYSRLNQLQTEFAQAWQIGDEQDYMQEKLDRELKRIFGSDFIPFQLRYPDIKRPK